MTFSIARGSDKDLEIFGLGDLTDCIGFLAVRNSVNNAIIIEKSTTNPADGEVGDGFLRFHFLQADTEGLLVSPLGNYSFDAWISTPTGKHFQVRPVTVFIVMPRVVGAFALL